MKCEIKLVKWIVFIKKHLPILGFEKLNGWRDIQEYKLIIMFKKISNEYQVRIEIKKHGMNGNYHSRTIR